jgi:hypothetical protein
MGFDKACWVVETVGQAKELLAQLASLLMLRTHEIPIP